MNRLAFAAYRALRVRPLSATLGVVVKRLTRKGAEPSPSNGVHPIDARYGIDTGGVIRASLLRTGSRSDLYNFGYVGSQPSIIRDVLARLPNIETASFVDFGCGKGRPLVVASEFKFKRIVGIELSPTLVATARLNVERLARDHPCRTRVEVIEGDVLTVPLPDGFIVGFFYNSMYPALVRRLADRLASDTRDLMLVYYNPVSARVFDRHPAYRRYLAERLEWSAEEAATKAWSNEHDSVVVWQKMETPVTSLSGAEARVRVVRGGVAGEVEAV